MKMSLQNIVLSPFSLLYGAVIFVRNLCYNRGWLKSTSFDMPVISVGNLAVGGTGKTPHIEFLIRILQDKYKLAVLSRGYKRSTKGFVMADDSSDSKTIGDEPFQIYRKFRDVMVVVDEKRVHGVLALLNNRPEVQVVLLDDAFQHRAIKPGLSILLTDYSRLYNDDLPLPGGRLRECASGSKRADMVVVTKCQQTMSANEMDDVEKSLKLLPHQQLYFSAIEYGDLKPLFDENAEDVNLRQISGMDVLLVTGIVSNKSLVAELENHGASVNVLAFPDHHEFSVNNYAEIKQKFIHLQTDNKIILITEKDAARMLTDRHFPEELKKFVYFIPISIQILQNKQNLFIKNILKYVESYTRNS